jgi:cysteine synthase A
MAAEGSAAPEQTRLLHQRTYHDIIETTCNTPLVRLNRLAPEHTTILVKCEFFNPLASVKDRIGRAMIEAAERDGTLRPNTHVVEPTSGNTGIALAFVCAARGYKLSLTMPESMSLERRALLRALGAELVLTPANEGMKGAIGKASEMVENDANAWMPQQFDNSANPEIHERTTGAEIWADTGGKADLLVAGVGTGGTLTGVTRHFRNQGRDDFRAIGVEPADSPVIQQTLDGAEPQPGPHKIQGIGAGFIPRNLDMDLMESVEPVSNEDAFEWARRLGSEEGIFGGISSGANVCAANRVAERPENKGKTIVTVACSFGERYLSTPMFEGLKV